MCSFCPWRHTRHLWSRLHLLCIQYVRASVPSVLPPADTGSGRRAASWWLCGKPSKHRSGMANISPPCLHGNIWPFQAHRALCLSVCLSHCEPIHIVSMYWCCHCTTIFNSYTGTGLLHKNKSQQYESKQAKCYIKTPTPFCDGWMTDLTALFWAALMCLDVILPLTPVLVN